MNVQDRKFTLSFCIFLSYSPNPSFPRPKKQPPMQPPKISFAYNFKVSSSDDGLNKDSDTDNPTTVWKFQNLRVGFSGKVRNNFSYKLQFEGFNRADINTGILDHAELTYRMKAFRITIGNPKGIVYGWKQNLQDH